MGKAQRIAVDEVIAALMERPDDFWAGEHTICDNKSGLKFWIANTPFDGGVFEPFRMGFGWYHSLRFHRAVRAWKAYKTAQLLRL